MEINTNQTQISFVNNSIKNYLNNSWKHNNCNENRTLISLSSARTHSIRTMFGCKQLYFWTLLLKHQRSHRDQFPQPSFISRPNRCQNFGHKQQYWICTYQSISQLPKMEFCSGPLLSFNTKNSFNIANSSNNYKFPMNTTTKIFKKN